MRTSVRQLRDVPPSAYSKRHLNRVSLNSKGPLNRYLAQVLIHLDRHAKNALIRTLYFRFRTFVLCKGDFRTPNVEMTRQPKIISHFMGALLWLGAPGRRASMASKVHRRLRDRQLARAALTALDCRCRREGVMRPRFGILGAKGIQKPAEAFRRCGRAERRPIDLVDKLKHALGMPGPKPPSTPDGVLF